MQTLLLVAACVIWGMVHSWTASIGFKSKAQRVLGLSGTNWFRLLYNGFSFITFLPLLVMTAVFPDQFLYEIPEPWADVTLIFQLMAVVALIAGVIQTDLWSFVGLRQIFGGAAETKMVTGGLYRFVRHPLYTAGLVFIWLTPVMTVNRLVLYLSLTVYIFIGAYFEERKLLREYGNEYEVYRSKTPMLVPALFRRS
jgi:protein-S-isoprenylcysteine O-methyltransferase Ste14